MKSDPESVRGFEARERIRDGRQLLVRAIRPDDKSEIRDALDRFSSESLYSRFFSPKSDLSPGELTYLTEIDFVDHVALVAVLRENDADRMVGGGRYIVCEREPDLAAELAFAVDDSHQGLGIATALLGHLVEIARAAGIAELRATVLAENRKMLSVFSHSSVPQHRERAGGVVEVRLSLAASGSAA